MPSAPVPSGDPVDARIRELRSADVSLTVRGADGLPLAGHEVVIAQRSHRFGFGCAAFDVLPVANGELDDAAAEAAERLLARWLAVFNTATLPFYWGRFEPRRGQPDTRRLMNAAAWLVERGCRVKGHPLCWHTITADWLLELADDDILAAQLDRIRREVTGFAGLIDAWDVINEVVIMPVFDRYENGITRMCRRLGQVETVRVTFEAARSANPNATLLLNDFDMSEAFERLIERCLDGGIRIDALGLQSHMHQGYWGEAKTL
ncbi:MAG TPA: endo-1,4-beta-xylanase, partial [Candidatus Limnocylindrales bacterium]|nr:endo-1,4-beta-xylanase [Candidatus Limnocylindrales bacterium]